MTDNEYSELSPSEHAKAERLRKIRKGFIIGAIAFVILIIVIPLAVYAGKRRGGDGPQTKLTFTFNDMFNSSLRPTSMSIGWGSGFYTFTDENGDINQYTLSTSEIVLLVNKSSVINGGVITGWDTYFTSPDASFVLFATQYQSKWRHSFTAVYYLYDVNGNTVTPLIDTTTRLLNVQWNPVHATTLAYVLNNDIYIYEITTKVSTQITNDGSAVIFNGVQSWVYEEEIFSDYNAMWWAPDGSSLAFMKSNESSVPIYSFPTYMPNQPYTASVQIPYPKPGYPNPSVTLHTYVLATQANTTFVFDAQWEYIYTVQWGNSADLIFVQLVTRSQNTRLIAKLTPSTATVTPLNSTSVNQGWLDISPLLIIDNSYLVSLEPDDKLANMHLAMRNQTTGQVLRYLTAGSWDVTSIVGWCPSAMQVYFLSSEVSSMQRHLYSVDVSGRKTQITTQTPAWYTASLAPTGGYYVLNYGGPDVPKQYLKSTTSEGYGSTLSSNAAYASIIGKYALPVVEYLTVQNSQGQSMNVKLSKPIGFSSGTTYPLILNVYGGPGSQTATYAHSAPFWDAYLTTQGYVYATIDGRGTGARGLSWLWSTYKHLGEFESQDQNDGATNLAKVTGFINATQMAIWGWSFGGYATAMVMGSGAGVFQAGISVAPVTDWTFYDSTYTERYMDTPQANPNGYNVSSTIPRAKNIPSDTFLLVHGTADDNVHYLNTAILERELVLNAIQFESMSYINQNHRINQDGSYPHLYQLMSNFLANHIPPIPISS